jgi:hypothetical protein
MEGVPGNQDISLLCGEPFEGKQIITRLEHAGIKTESESVLGARRQLTLSPYASAVGCRDGNPVGLKISIRS